MNLLNNPSFEDRNHLTPPAGIAGLLPAGWTLAEFARPGLPRLDRQDDEWLQPEIIPIQFGVQFPEPYLRYDPSGTFVLKVFKGHGPTFATFEQRPVLPAARYRFTVPIFPDQWHNAGSGQVRPSYATSADFYLGSEVRIFAGGYDSDWMDARKVRIGHYNVLIADFDWPGGACRVGFSVRGRWGFRNNGWFVDGCSLEDVRDIVAPPSPPAMVTPPARDLRYGIGTGWWRLYDPRLALIDNRQKFSDEFVTLGATCLFLGFDWVQFEPYEGVFDWRIYDAIVPHFTGRGIHVVGLLYTAPKWATSDAGDWNPTKELFPDKVGAVANAARALAARYPVVRNWVFWNEPDGPMADPAVFAAWQVAFYDALKSVDSTLKVGMGTKFSEGRFTLDFVAGVKGVLGGRQAYDAISLHPYLKGGPTPFMNTAQIDDIHQFDLSAEIWITEYGWHVGDQGNTEQTQADDLLLALSWFANRTWIVLAAHLMLSDEPGALYGLLTAGFARRPAYGVFANFPKGEVGPPPPPPPPPPPGPDWLVELMDIADDLTGLIAAIEAGSQPPPPTVPDWLTTLKDLETRLRAVIASIEA